MSSRNKVIGLLVVGIAAYGAYSKFRGAFSSEDDPSLLFERVWIEKAPEKPTEYVHALFVSESQPAGVFINGSSYDIRVERFDYKLGKGKLAVTFPQTEKKAEIGFTVAKCSDKQPFDVCLDLSSNPWGGPKRYYGVLDQEQESRVLPKLRERARFEMSPAR